MVTPCTPSLTVYEYQAVPEKPTSGVKVQVVGAVAAAQPVRVPPTTVSSVRRESSVSGPRGELSGSENSIGIATGVSTGVASTPTDTPGPGCPPR